MLRARVDRFRCIGAGNCITIAPSAFDWHDGDFAFIVGPFGKTRAANRSSRLNQRSGGLKEKQRLGRNFIAEFIGMLAIVAPDTHNLRRANGHAQLSFA